MRANQLEGQKFGKLTVVSRSDNSKSGKTKWLCKCECGNETIVYGDKLKSGHTTSCGRCNYIPIRIGDRFGRWTVVSDTAISVNGHKKYLCKCGCIKGTESYIAEYSLKSGNSRSCGCITCETNTERMSTHHKSKTRLFHVWESMKSRCYNSHNKSYKNYGGRGIKVCEEWLNDFEAFYSWAMANGYDENAQYGECTIDRIKVNENYNPDNCRWADADTQALNRRSNVWITYNGETHSLSEWSEITGINRATLRQRLKKGCKGEELFSKSRLNPWDRRN